MTSKGPSPSAQEGAFARLLADIDSEAELLAYAYAMESEAAERYDELSDQLALHNNHDVAEVFAKLAEIERRHADEIASKASGMTIRRRAPWEYRWLDPEGPESLPVADVHYRITPARALGLALYNEERALAFYERLARATKIDAVRALARDFAEEEREHVRLMQEWLDRYADQPEAWDEDPDPAVSQ